MKLSEPKLRGRIDLWVSKVDPAAVRIPPKVDEQRYVEIEPTSMGMAWIGGHMHATDAAAFDQRLDALAATVCENDPRTKAQRRADACGPLARYEAQLRWQCRSADCPATTEPNAAAAAVIHVLAEQATLAGGGDKPGYLPGFGMVPAASVRALAASAIVKQVAMPTATPDPGYRPSTVTRQFVQWRDLTCRWPGCDAPAEACDYDHTVPYPASPTHASTGKLYCRGHHLIKTFYGGAGGWTDRQLPDGTIVLTAPTGHVYRTEPHGGALFSALSAPTAPFDLPTLDNPPHPDRAVMMPRRKQTRDQDRQDRIKAERRQRTELIAEEERQRQAWLAANYEPPPF
jgi:hypothetical protein